MGLGCYRGFHNYLYYFGGKLQCNPHKTILIFKAPALWGLGFKGLGFRAEALRFKLWVSKEFFMNFYEFSTSLNKPFQEVCF